MPEMSPAMSPFSVNSSVPSMIGLKKEDHGLPSTSRRFIVFSKSLALTGVPSLYLRPVAQLNL